MAKLGISGPDLWVFLAFRTVSPYALNPKFGLECVWLQGFRMMMRPPGQLDVYVLITFFRVCRV